MIAAAEEPGIGVMVFTVVFTVVAAAVLVSAIFRAGVGRWPWQ